jgi:titin
VTVTWTDNTANETSYRLERSVNGGSFLLWIVLGANTTGYVDTAVTAGSTYSYRVVAANSVAYSTASNAGTATIPVPGVVPAAPSSLVRTAVTRTSIAIGWVDNATNETGFHVERSTNRSTWTRVATLGANARGYNSTGLKSNTTYYFRVRAYNTTANSAYTTTLMAKTLR